ncbi:uncharacterized protein VSU04_003412 [Chlamydotis macqueenii]
MRPSYLQFSLQVKRLLENESNVYCLTATADASRTGFGIMMENGIKVWDPFEHQHNVIPGYEGVHHTVISKVQLLEERATAVLPAGYISLWDFNSCTVTSVFTTDSKMSYLTSTGQENNSCRFE